MGVNDQIPSESDSSPSPPPPTTPATPALRSPFQVPPLIVPVFPAVAPTMATATFSNDQLLELISKIKTSSSSSSTKFPKPRVGGINNTGVWTGRGSDGKGQDPKSASCMRAFKADVIKNHQAVAPIETKWQEGLNDVPALLFSTLEESNADKVVASIYAFEDLMVNFGMEGIFFIFTKDGKTSSMLQSPDMISTDMIGHWCDDVLNNGVIDNTHPDPVTSASNVASNKRLTVCPCDRVNMLWSGEAVLNSSTETLKQDLKLSVPLDKRTGPYLMCAVLHKIYRPSQSNPGRPVLLNNPPWVRSCGGFLR